MILAAASIVNPDYVPENYQTFLLTVLIMLTHGAISSMPTLWIARFNSVGTVVNMLCLMVTIIVIPAAATTSPDKFRPSEFAWGVQNGTSWPDGVAVLMSFLSIIWTMSGYDCSFHIAEECSNAAVATPRSIVMTAGSGSVLGFVLNTLIAYTIVDVDAAMNSELVRGTNLPFPHLFSCHPLPPPLSALCFLLSSGLFLLPRLKKSRPP